MLYYISTENRRHTVNAGGDLRVVLRHAELERIEFIKLYHTIL